MLNEDKRAVAEKRYSDRKVLTPNYNFVDQSIQSTTRNN